MKHNLNEQLSRIFYLTYGKKNINESDDPKKADLVNDNVNDFYNSEVLVAIHYLYLPF